MPLAKVVVTYDLKKSCGESVRVKATAVENSAVPVVVGHLMKGFAGNCLLPLRPQSSTRQATFGKSHPCQRPPHI